MSSVCRRSLTVESETATPSTQRLRAKGLRPVAMRLTPWLLRLSYTLESMTLLRLIGARPGISPRQPLAIGTP